MALEIGAILEGTVVNITNFGAFVDIDGKTGLVHISEVADNYVKDIKDFLKPGDKVKVKVVSIDPNGKVSLSIKQAMAGTQTEAKKSSRPKEEWQSDLQERNDRFERRAKPMEKGPQTFEDMMSRFQKDSEEKMAEFKKRQEGGNIKRRRG